MDCDKIYETETIEYLTIKTLEAPEAKKGCDKSTFTFKYQAPDTPSGDFSVTDSKHLLQIHIESFEVIGSGITLNIEDPVSEMTHTYSSSVDRDDYLVSSGRYFNIQFIYDHIQSQPKAKILITSGEIGKSYNGILSSALGNTKISAYTPFYPDFYSGTETLGYVISSAGGWSTGSMSKMTFNVRDYYIDGVMSVANGKTQEILANYTGSGENKTNEFKTSDSPVGVVKLETYDPERGLPAKNRFHIDISIEQIESGPIIIEKREERKCCCCVS